MNIRVAPVEPAAPLPSNLTNDEVLDRVYHQYPRLGGALGVAMLRFRMLVDAVSGRVPFPDFQPEKVNCPHCGSALIITDQKETPSHGT